MNGSVLRTLPLVIIVAVSSTQPTAAASRRCQRTTQRRLVVLADAAHRCMAACTDDAAAGASRQCRAGSPDVALGGCLERAVRKARARISRKCRRVDFSLEDFVQGILSEGGAPAICGDGRLDESERCDESAPPNGGCPDGQACTACLSCHPVCGDGRIVGDEVCEPGANPSGCPGDESCLDCQSCGRSAPLVTADEDVAPCASSVGDRWTFAVEAGNIVTIAVDTVDDASAAKLAFEGSCPSRSFRAGVGFPCSFPPPNDPNPGYGCPRLSFVAAASGTCSLTIGAVPRLDVGDGAGCNDPAIARYRLSVNGTSLTLTGDDVAPGLLSH
jgi:hypothetical protein